MLDWVALPILPAIKYALHQGLEKSNTVLSILDPFLLEPITKLAFVPDVLLAGLTQWRQGSNGKQPIAYTLYKLCS